MKSASVNAIIFSKDNKSILIIKRRDVPVWVLPGGAVENGESNEEAILREVKEETGCTVNILRKSGIYYPINRLAVTTHVFVCEITGGSLQIGKETLSIGYFSIDSLPKSFFHIHKDFVENAVKNQQTVIEQPLKQVTYLELAKYFLCHPLRVFRFALSKLGFPINS